MTVHRVEKLGAINHPILEPIGGEMCNLKKKTTHKNKYRSKCKKAAWNRKNKLGQKCPVHKRELSVWSIIDFKNSLHGIRNSQIILHGFIQF